MSRPPEKPPAPDDELRRVWKRYRRTVRRWIRLAGVAPRHVPDVEQATWIRVHRTLPRYRRELPFGPWLFTIARRAVLDHRRTTPDRHEELGGAMDPLVEHRFGVEERMDAEHILPWLLSQMTDEQHEVFVLVEIEGHSLKEVAEVLDVPVGTVQSRLSRARDAFGAALRRLRARESRRVGAVVPLFLYDTRALFEEARKEVPISEHAEEAMWRELVRAIEADGGAKSAGLARVPRVPRGWPRWLSPGSFFGGAGTGGLIVYLLMRPVPAPPERAAEPAGSVAATPGGAVEARAAAGAGAAERPDSRGSGRIAEPDMVTSESVGAGAAGDPRAALAPGAGGAPGAAGNPGAALGSGARAGRVRRAGRGARTGSGRRAARGALGAQGGARARSQGPVRRRAGEGAAARRRPRAERPWRRVRRAFAAHGRLFEVGCRL